MNAMLVNRKECDVASTKTANHGSRLKEVEVRQTIWGTVAVLRGLGRNYPCVTSASCMPTGEPKAGIPATTSYLRPCSIDMD